MQYNINYWPQDVTRIDLRNSAELKYWEDRFNTTIDNIVAAIQEVGPTTIAVDEYLKNNRIIAA